jgi:hypothetical protein
MSAPNPSAWDIQLSAWVIQDGSYPDFEVGQTAEFALEFWLPEGAVARPSSEEVSATNLGDCLYDTVAEALVQTDQMTVMNIGVLVYQQIVPTVISARTPLCCATETRGGRFPLLRVSKQDR